VTRQDAPHGIAHPELRSARLRLRPFTDADATPLYALHSSAHVLRYWDSPPWTEPACAQRFIAAGRTIEEEGTGARVAVDRVSDGAFLGWCGLTSWNPDFRSASLGYVFDAAALGHGYATEATHAVLWWAFHALDLNCVQAETDTRNVRPGPGEARLCPRRHSPRGLRRQRRRLRLLRLRPPPPRVGSDGHAGGQPLGPRPVRLSVRNPHRGHREPLRRSQRLRLPHRSRPSAPLVARRVPPEAAIFSSACGCSRFS
jgi:ribosomal-protein-alanine N-acetyltransferase